MTKEEVIWQPQPGPQQILVSCPVQEIFFGGARGGGKTDGMIGWSETVVANREKTGLRPSGCKIGYQINYVRQTYPYVMTDGLYHPKLGEWLNGWPLGWSQLQPLETDKFREWQQQHSLC